MVGIYLEDLKSLVLNHLANYKVRVYLFGSYARGEARNTSDVDLAILPLEPISNSVLVELRDKIEESTLPYQIDLIDMSIATDDLKAQILAEGLLWKD